MNSVADVSGIMAGKRGLVMGVANERSIAWGISAAAAAQGAAPACLPRAGEGLQQLTAPHIS